MDQPKEESEDDKVCRAKVPKKRAKKKNIPEYERMEAITEEGEQTEHLKDNDDNNEWEVTNEEKDNADNIGEGGDNNYEKGHGCRPRFLRHCRIACIFRSSGLV